MADVINDCNQFIEAAFQSAFYFNAFKIWVFGIPLINLYTIFIFWKFPVGLAESNGYIKTGEKEEKYFDDSRFHKTEISILWM